MNSKKKFIPHTVSLLGLLLWMVGVPLQAQQVYGQPDIWWTWQNQWQFAPKWQLATELHARFDNYLAEPEQLLFRPSIHYQAAPSIRFGGGYSYVHTFPYGEHPLESDRPEHNIWQQVLFSQRIQKIRVSHRLRLEERFQTTWNPEADAYTFEQLQFRTRFRYRFTVNIPLQEHWFIQLFDELWIGSGATMGQVAFDRNWLSAGVGYRFSDHVSLSLAYLHQYVKHHQDLYEQHHTLQVTLSTTMTKPTPKE